MLHLIKSNRFTSDSLSAAPSSALLNSLLHRPSILGLPNKPMIFIINLLFNCFFLPAGPKKPCFVKGNDSALIINQSYLTAILIFLGRHYTTSNMCHVFNTVNQAKNL